MAIVEVPLKVGNYLMSLGLFSHLLSQDLGASEFVMSGFFQHVKLNLGHE